jgi:hypothetical protein
MNERWRPRPYDILTDCPAGLSNCGICDFKRKKTVVKKEKEEEEKPDWEFYWETPHQNE